LRGLYLAESGRGPDFLNQHGGDAAGMGTWTSLCMTSVLNLGNSPRVLIVRVPENNKEQEDAGKKLLPAKRDERDSCPSHRLIMRLLSMAVIPEERGAFRKQFWKACKDQEERCCDFLVRLRSQSSQKPLDVNHSNCVLHLTCSPGLERSLSS
jgi:hypothetical protein